MDHKPFPIRNEQDYARALALVRALWDAPPASEEADVLDVMSALVEAYERPRRELPPADPIQLIEFKMRELGWSQRDLTRKLGWKSTGRVSEILSRKRPLTLAMVRDLSEVLGIPSGLLVHDAPDDRWFRLSSATAQQVRECSTAIGVTADSLVERAVCAVIGAPWTLVSATISADERSMPAMSISRQRSAA